MHSKEFIYNCLLAHKYMQILYKQLQHNFINYKIVDYQFISDYLRHFDFDTSVINIMFKDFTKYIIKYKK